MAGGEQAQLQAGLKQVGDTIEPALKNIYAKVDQLVDAANRFLSYAQYTGGMGALAAWWIRSNIEDIRKALKEIAKFVNLLIQHYTPVISLILASFRWINEVKTPLSELQFEATRAANRNFRTWEGKASEEYHSIADEQKEALADVVEKSEFVSKWLLTIARENVAFAKEMFSIVTKLLGILAKALANASLAMVPFAIDDAAEMIGVAVEEGLNALAKIAERLVANIGNARDQVAASGDHSKLSSRKWPDAVTVQ
jgi:hypothetical protein